MPNKAHAITFVITRMQTCDAGNRTRCLFPMNSWRFLYFVLAILCDGSRALSDTLSGFIRTLYHPAICQLALRSGKAVATTERWAHLTGTTQAAWGPDSHR